VQPNRAVTCPTHSPIRSWVRTRALRPYLRYYDVRRPHTALRYRTPLARFASVNDVFVNDI